MLIQPNTFVRLIKGCPLDNSYKDTIYFETPTEQYSYFRNTLTNAIPLNKQSYQRYAEGVITVNVSADDLYGVNYMMFQNGSFGAKWFYAFVNEIEYVGNSVSRVYYEIDIMQTWMFDYRDNIKPCFIERQHSVTDNAGDNLVPEDVAIGDYTVIDHTTPMLDSPPCIVLQYKGTADYDDGEVNIGMDSGFYGGTYQGTKFLATKIDDETTIEQLNVLIEVMSSLDPFNNVISLFSYPYEMLRKYNEAGRLVENGPSFSFAFYRPYNLDGYVPKNKKLLTYPYVCANLSSATNEGHDFAFELFDENKATFKVTSTLAPGANLIGYPTNYNGENECPHLGVSGPPYPTCSYSPDSFAQWLSATATSALTISATGNLSTAVRSFTPTGGLTAEQLHTTFMDNRPVKARGPKTTAEAEYRDIARAGAAFEYLAGKGGLYGGTRSVTENDIRGGINASLSGMTKYWSGCTASTSSLFATRRGGLITGKVKTLRYHNAKIVDDYFTMYGYAVNSIQTPNFHARSKWTYIKTCGFSAYGNVPSGDMAGIRALHDRGITYWDKDAVIGDYSVNNNIL